MTLQRNTSRRGASSNAARASSARPDLAYISTSAVRTKRSAAAKPDLTARAWSEAPSGRVAAEDEASAAEGEGEGEGVGEEAGRAREEPAEDEQGLQRERGAEVGAHDGADDERVRVGRLDQSRVRRQVLRPRRTPILPM